MFELLIRATSARSQYRRGGMVFQAKPGHALAVAIAPLSSLPEGALQELLDDANIDVLVGAAADESGEFWIEASDTEKLAKFEAMIADAKSLSLYEFDGKAGTSTLLTTDPLEARRLLEEGRPDDDLAEAAGEGGSGKDTLGILAEHGATAPRGAVDAELRGTGDGKPSETTPAPPPAKPTGVKPPKPKVAKATGPGGKFVAQGAGANIS